MNCGWAAFHSRAIRVLSAIGVSVAVAACQTTLQSSAVPAPETPAAATLAFEGFVGVPKRAGDEVISALVSAGAVKRFAIVQAGDPRAAYVLRGYLAQQAEGGTTAINYVWDVFDRAGNRLQRLMGETRLPAAVADGWTLVQGSGARDIAEASAVDIARFLAGGHPTTVAAGPAPAATPAGSLKAPAPEPAVSTGSNAPARQARLRSISVGDVGGIERAAALRLKSAAEKALGEVGYTIVAPGAPSDVRLSAEATVNPGSTGTRLAAMVWRVANGQGQELGEVRQLASLGVSGVEAQPVVNKAIDGMLSGVVALAPPRP